MTGDRHALKQCSAQPQQDFVSKPIHTTLSVGEGLSPAPPAAAWVGKQLGHASTLLSLRAWNTTPDSLLPTNTSLQMLSCDPMFLQSLRVINAGAGSQGLHEGRADSTRHHSTSPAAAPGWGGSKSSLACVHGAAALSALWEGKKERGKGLREQDSSDLNQPGKGVSDSPPQPLPSQQVAALGPRLEEEQL